jgi:hypothetical protein
VISYILIGQNHLYVKMLFNRVSAFRRATEDSALFSSQRFRFLASRPDDVSSRPDAQLFIVPSRPDDVTFRPDVLQTKASSVRTMCFYVRTLLCIEKLLFQLASVRTFQQLVKTTLSVRSSFRFSFQKQIWEDCCNCPNDVDSRPDALLLKVSLQFKLNHPDVGLPWSGRAYDRYGNYV